MGKLQDDETGFSAVELLLILVMVALIGAAGWLVYKNHHKATTTSVATSTTKTSTTPAKTTTTTPAQPADPTAGWATYTSTIGSFSFKYPTTWNIDGHQGNNGGPLDASQFNGTETIISLFSQPQTVDTNNFGFSLNIVPSGGVSYPLDTSTGTSQKLNNGLFAWQANETSKSNCPGFYLLSSNQSSNIPISNSQKLNVSASFCEAQKQSTTYSYQQQVSSPEWAEAKEIFASFKIQ